MPNPYVQSNFPRVPNDYYPTIDKRCVYGFLEHFRNLGRVVDPCAPNGSGIVDTLLECGVAAEGLPDAFGEFEADWVVCNPPYVRGLVDDIIYRQIQRLQNGEVGGVAMLLRNNFAFAKSRKPMFQSEYYLGEIKLLFRPWWSDEHSKQPIHNFVWHIWKSQIFKFTTGVWVSSDGEKYKPTVCHS